VALSVRGAAAIETMLRNTVILYDDGTPKTKHLITNISIEVDEDARTGTARSYVTVLQSRPGLRLQPIASGRYHDRFERHDGEWVFAERRVSIDLLGDAILFGLEFPSTPIDWPMVVGEATCPRSKMGVDRHLEGFIGRA
jgi:SnoaL-like domain